MKNKIRAFDFKKAESSKQRLENLGAQFTFITPKDNKGKIQVMTFSWEALETKIKKAGGHWQEYEIDQQKVLAIRRPENHDNNFEWQELKRN